MPAAQITLLCFFCSTHVLLQIVLVHQQSVHGFSVSQKDCQVNEQFIECGTCEGSCREPIIANCRKECKPPRCECRAMDGYVRAHDGACVPVSECATYKGIHLAKDSKMPMSVALPPSVRPPSAGRHHQKKLEDQVIQVGLSPPVIIKPTGKGRAIGTSRMNLFADLSNSHSETDDAEGSAGAAEATTVTATRRTVVHSIKHSQSLDSLLHQRKDGSSARRSRKSQGQQQGQTGVIGVEEASENAKLAKCGERRCSAAARREIDGRSQSEQMSTSVNKSSNAFLFAFINPRPAQPSASDQRNADDISVPAHPTKQQNSARLESAEKTVEEEDGTLPEEGDANWPTGHLAVREQRQIVPLAPHLRIYRQRSL